MTKWTNLVLLFIPAIVRAVNFYYVSEGTSASDQAASICTLATPNINYKTGTNNVSLDAKGLGILDGESLWIGYVQTYSAFLYEGCCDEQFANSAAVYTNVDMDPGKCYSKCKTEVIGVQMTTCHCMPIPEEAQKRDTGCHSLCNNPDDTLCGGSKRLSIYRKVTYPTSRAAEDEEKNCRALQWSGDGEHFYKWDNCYKSQLVMCTTGASAASNASLKFAVYTDPNNWRGAVQFCLEKNQSPAVELSSGYPDFNVKRSNLYWTGQMRSHVIDKDADKRRPGLRRGFIKNIGGWLVLQFETGTQTFKALCQNASISTTQQTHSTESTSSPQHNPYHGENNSNEGDSTQFPMIAVYVAAPVILALLVVVVIVLRLRRRPKHATNRNKDSSRERDAQPSAHEMDTTVKSKDNGVLYGKADISHEDDYAVIMESTKPETKDTTDENEYDRTINLSAMNTKETDNIYNKLNDTTMDSLDETNGNGLDMYDRIGSKEGPLKTSKSNTMISDSVYNKASDFYAKAGDTLYVSPSQTVSSGPKSEVANEDDAQITYAKPIPRSQRK